MNIDPRSAILGSDRTRSLEGIAVATGLYGVVLVISFLPVSAGWLLEPGLVIVGVGLASLWAYENSGLAVSIVLVLFPVLGRLTYYSWLSVGRPVGIALPLSFGGAGAWEMWITLAVFLGTVAFELGILLRWSLHLKFWNAGSVV